MHAILWRFTTNDPAAFERHYGPDGTWARLFRRDANYIRTDLLKNEETYLTIDWWTSSGAYDAFRETHAGDYAEIDRMCEALTVSETKVGEFAMNPAILALHHVQLAMPRGQENTAREFYCGVLGFVEVPKPAHLAARGGAWFRSGTAEVHLGVEDGFRPAMKAHPALLVENLPELAARCHAAGFTPTTDQPLPGFDRVYVTDPFGNRIELLEPATDER